MTAEAGAAWEAAIGLAWASYREDTVPVGAVITDGNGAIVSRGRNQIHEASGATSTLANSRLAHAEVNAILGLPLTHSSYFVDHTIFTTTEPCLLCAGAITMTKVGRVAFAAADPIAGSAAAMTTGNPYLEHRRTVVSGPLRGDLAAFSRLLTEEWSWRSHENGLVERLCREREPEVAAIVEQVHGRGVLPALAAAGADVSAAMSAVGDEIAALAAALDGRQSRT